jgi:hypothetical protein
VQVQEQEQEPAQELLEQLLVLQSELQLVHLGKERMVLLFLNI